MTHSRRSIRFSKNPTKAHGNPFRFPYSNKSSRLPLIGAILIILVLAGLMYWLFFSSCFAIETIEVQSSLNLPVDKIKTRVSEQVQSKRWKVVSQRNIFAFDSVELTQKISGEFFIEKIYIKKDRPHKIVITSSEISREAVWGTRNLFYALDAQGIVLGTMSEAQIGDSLVIYDQSGGVPNPKEQIMDTAVLNFAVHLVQDEHIKILSPQFFIMEEAMAADLILKVGEGWKIYFDTKEDLNDQLENLNATLTHSIPPDKRNTLNYIDLRFGEKVYFKYK